MISDNEKRVKEVEELKTNYYQTHKNADYFLNDEGRLQLWLENIILPLFFRYIKPETKVLDVACGTGRMAIGFKKYGCHVTGTDVSELMLEHLRNKTARENLEIETVHANAKELPFEDNSFDAIVSMCFLQHFANWREYLTEQIRVVKKGGFVGYEFSFKEHEYMAHSLGASRISQYVANDDITDTTTSRFFYATTTLPELKEFCSDNGAVIEAIMPHTFLDHNAFFMNATTIDVCRTAKNEIIPKLINDPNVIEYAKFFENEMVSNMPFWAARKCIVMLKKL